MRKSIVQIVFQKLCAPAKMIFEFGTCGEYFAVNQFTNYSCIDRAQMRESIAQMVFQILCALAKIFLNLTHVLVILLIN